MQYNKKEKGSNISIFRVPVDEIFIDQWIQYSVFSNNIYLRYIEILIHKDKSLSKQFIMGNSQDSKELKSLKKMLSNILFIKEKGHTDWFSIRDLVPEFQEQENINELKFKYMDLNDNPKIPMESFISLFDEKMKQFVTIEHIQSFINTLYDNQDNIDNIQNLDVVTKKFNSIMFSYLEKMTSVISKNNSEVLEKNTIVSKLEDIMQSSDNQFKLHETIKTGFQTLDTDIYTNGGFQKSRFYLISGKTGFGKSQFLINLTKNFLEQGKTVLFITLENTMEETNDRLFSCITGMSLQDLYCDTEKTKNLVVDFFKKNNGLFLLEHVPQNSLSKQMIDTIIKMRISQTNRKPDVIIVDYMDLMLYPERLEERIRLQRLQNQMKQLAQEQNCVTITPTQVNRQAYQKDDTIDLENISESSGKAWVQDSVLILNGDKDLVQSGYIELFIQKNRHGKSYKKILFQIDFDKMRFIDTGKTSYDVNEYNKHCGQKDDKSNNTKNKVEAEISPVDFNFWGK